VQLRLAEPQQGDGGENDQGRGHEVGGPERHDLGEHATEQGADDQSRALHEADTPDRALEQVAVAGLLQHGVVGDRLERARLHGEEHS
jgi:hypothetical protein